MVREHNFYYFNPYKFISDLSYALTYVLFWRIFRVHLRGMCILLLVVVYFIGVC